MERGWYEDIASAYWFHSPRIVRKQGSLYSGRYEYYSYNPMCSCYLGERVDMKILFLHTGSTNHEEWECKSLFIPDGMKTIPIILSVVVIYGKRLIWRFCFCILVPLTKNGENAMVSLFRTVLNYSYNPMCSCYLREEVDVKILFLHTGSTHQEGWECKGL